MCPSWHQILATPLLTLGPTEASALMVANLRTKTKEDFGVEVERYNINGVLSVTDDDNRRQWCCL